MKEAAIRFAKGTNCKPTIANMSLLTATLEIQVNAYEPIGCNAESEAQPCRKCTVYQCMPVYRRAGWFHSKSTFSCVS